MFTSIKYIALVFVLTLTACYEQDQNQYMQDIVIETPLGQQAVFSVSIADTPEKQQKGLMFVENMPDNEGMIFIYNEPQITKFWMKNTLIPLDILFFDPEGTLTHIEHSAVPHDETPRGPNKPICSVVEINGGLVKKIDITLGSKLIGDFLQECLQSSDN